MDKIKELHPISSFQTKGIKTNNVLQLLILLYNHLEEWLKILLQLMMTLILQANMKNCKNMKTRKSDFKNTRKFEKNIRSIKIQSKVHLKTLLKKKRLKMLIWQHQPLIHQSLKNGKKCRRKQMIQWTTQLVDSVPQEFWPHHKTTWTSLSVHLELKRIQVKSSKID